MVMPYLRTRLAVAVGLALLTVGAAAGFFYETVNERSQLRAHAAAATGGDPSRGEAMFIQYGCGSCHGVKHVRKASGGVGPPLDGIPVRAVIAGKLANSPANLQEWIRDPQRISPDTAMPDLNVGERDARDITAFLYTRAE
jgi:cytochrome c2